MGRYTRKEDGRMYYVFDRWKCPCHNLRQRVGAGCATEQIVTWFFAGKPPRS